MRRPLADSADGGVKVGAMSAQRLGHIVDGRVAQRSNANALAHSRLRSLAGQSKHCALKQGYAIIEREGHD